MGKRKEATVEKLYENLANHLRQKVVEQSNLQNELLACSCVLVHVNLVWMLPSLLPCCALHIYLFAHWALNSVYKNILSYSKKKGPLVSEVKSIT